eukprot:6797370-Prymnesium_polylepis.1
MAPSISLRALVLGLATLSATQSAKTDDSSELDHRWAVFALVRGGSTAADYDSFINSRRCLRDSMPPAISYDDIVFHEGNIHPELQLNLQRKLVHLLHEAEALVRRAGAANCGLRTCSRMAAFREEHKYSCPIMEAVTRSDIATW